MDHKYSRKYPIRDSNFSPSFSSTLLDAIYHSIDHQAQDHDQNQTMHKQLEHTVASNKPRLLYRDYSEKVVVRRKSPAVFDERNSRSGSDSRCGGVGHVSSSANRPKPIRTSNISSNQEKSHKHQYNPKDYFGDPVVKQKGKYEEGGSFVKTKSRALKKIYRELKQPISPGSGRLSTFLNSLFNTNGRKEKNSSNRGRYDDEEERKLKSTNYASSTCSSASRSSCLTKNVTMTTPPSRTKRSVRFYLVDEENHHKNNLYEKKVEREDQCSNMRTKHMKNILQVFDYGNYDINEEDEDDDGASCDSSDLFELHNLSELPVYGTTNPLFANV